MQSKCFVLVCTQEWLSCVHRKVMKSLDSSEDSSGNQTFYCQMDFADICLPLEVFCRNSNVFAPKQGINFDDINDCGLLSIEGPQIDKVQKTWKEPVGLRVCFHFVVNYKWVLTIALWLLWSAVLLHDSKAFEDWVGLSSREPTLTRFTAFSLAFIDSLWLCFLMTCEVFVSDSPTKSTIGRKHLNRCLRFTRGLRVIPTLLLAVAWAWISWPDVFLDFLRLCKVDEAIITQVDVLPENFAQTIWYAPVAWIALRFAYGVTPRFKATNAFQLLHMAYWKRTAAHCCPKADLPF